MNLRRIPTIIATLAFVLAASASMAGAAMVSNQAGGITIVCVPCDPDKEKGPDKDPDIDPWHDTGPE